MPEDPNATPPATPPADPPATPPATPPAEPHRPDWCPEQFWKNGKVDQEGMAKSYVEAQHKLSEIQNPPPNKKDATQGLAISPPTPGQLPEDAGIEQVISGVGLDPNELGQKWAENQALDPEDYQKLAAAGFRKGVVDEFFGLVQRDTATRVEKVNQIAQQAAGSKEKLDNLLAWAGSALSEEERASLNADINNPIKTMDVVNALLARHSAAVSAGNARPLIEGEGAPAGAKPFTSQAEYIAATQDPRYRFDQVYRAEVDRRMMASESIDSLPKR